VWNLENKNSNFPNTAHFLAQNSPNEGHFLAQNMSNPLAIEKMKEDFNNDSNMNDYIDKFTKNNSEEKQLKLKDVNWLLKNVSFDFRKIFYKYLHSWFVLNFDFTNFFFFGTWFNSIKKLIKASYIYHRKSLFDTFSRIFSNLYISGTNFNSSAKISLLC